ncbi:MAG TPA: hypothetical protein VMN37_00010 [Gemmatimonadales bacterium]|nr:hypothetical protein [Gemmatimonadales bacterium]
MLSWIGWVATAVFAASYLCRDAALLRRVQAAAALLWIGYGVLLEAPPVIVANLIVAAMALYSSRPDRWRLSRPVGDTAPPQRRSSTST